MNGKLYGTTFQGGVAGCANQLGCGTVFSLDLASGDETVLNSFCTQKKCRDGEYPGVSLIAVFDRIESGSQTFAIAGPPGPRGARPEDKLKEPATQPPRVRAAEESFRSRTLATGWPALRPTMVS